MISLAVKVHEIEHKQHHTDVKLFSRIYPSMSTAFIFVSDPAKVSYVISQHEDILTNHSEKLDIVVLGVHIQYESKQYFHF